MTKDEEHQLTTLLDKLEPGYLPYDIFVAIARLVALPIIEMVPLRKNKNGVEVLLLERGEDDPIWPGMVHSPGTVIRATDASETLFGAFERIKNDELNGMTTSDPYFVGSMFHQSRRGTEYAQIYWVEVLESPITGKFYSVNKLPKNLVENQEKFIKEAANSYMRKPGRPV